MAILIPLTPAWTKIAAAGASVEITCSASGSDVQLAVSASTPSAPGQVLKRGKATTFKALAQDLYAASLGTSSTIQKGNAAPVQSVTLYGLIVSTIPAALKTKTSWLYSDPVNYPQQGAPAWDTVWTSIRFRPEAPGINTSSMTTVSAVPGVAELASATLSISYDATNSRTTYHIQNASSFARTVLPLDLRCVDDLVSSGFPATVTSPTDFYPFSGNVNGVAYQGQAGPTLYGNYGYAADDYSNGGFIPSYQFFDTDGSILAIVHAMTSEGPKVYLPGYHAITLPSGRTASAKAGSGFFSQKSGGQTLTGIYRPNCLMTNQPIATVNDVDPYFYDN